MWVFIVLLGGLVVASAVFALELRKWLRHSRRGQRVTHRLRGAWRALFGPIDIDAVRLRLASAASETATARRFTALEVPAEVPRHGRRWCREGAEEGLDGACHPERMALVPARPAQPVPKERPVPLLSEIVTKAPPPPETAPESGMFLASRPGELVRPDALDQAPPLPDEDDRPTEEPVRPTADRRSTPFFQSLQGEVPTSMSVEIDLEDFEDFVDTQPSLALTAKEAEALLAKAAEESHGSPWDKRDTQPRDRVELAEILPNEAPTGRGRLAVG